MTTTHAQNAKNDATPNAQVTYQAHANDIARLIDVLEMELQKHADAAQAETKNWAKVRDLGKVRSDLIEMVEFMSGMDRQTIENFLAE
jgi:hypothetical protein